MKCISGEIGFLSACHIQIKKSRVSHILFVEKTGLIIYLAVLKNGAIRHAYPYYAIYGKLPHPHPENGGGNLYNMFLISPIKHTLILWVFILTENILKCRLLNLLRVHHSQKWVGYLRKWSAQNFTITIWMSKHCSSIFWIGNTQLYVHWGSMACPGVLFSAVR